MSPPGELLARCQAAKQIHGLKGSPGAGEIELKGGSRGRPDDWLGNMIAALIPVSGFPMRC